MIIRSFIFVLIAVRGSDGISMVHGPPKFRQHAGFGRYAYELTSLNLFFLKIFLQLVSSKTKLSDIDNL